MEKTLVIMNKGKKVMGKDQNVSTITVRFQVLESVRKGLIKTMTKKSVTVTPEKAGAKILEVIVHSVQ